MSSTNNANAIQPIPSSVTPTTTMSAAPSTADEHVDKVKRAITSMSSDQMRMLLMQVDPALFSRVSLDNTNTTTTTEAASEVEPSHEGCEAKEEGFDAVEPVTPETREAEFGGTTTDDKGARFPIAEVVLRRRLAATTGDDNAAVSVPSSRMTDSRESEGDAKHVKKQKVVSERAKAASPIRESDEHVAKPAKKQKFVSERTKADETSAKGEKRRSPQKFPIRNEEEDNKWRKTEAAALRRPMSAASGGRNENLQDSSSGNGDIAGPKGVVARALSLHPKKNGDEGIKVSKKKLTEAGRAKKQATNENNAKTDPTDADDEGGMWDPFGEELDLRADEMVNEGGATIETYGTAIRALVSDVSSMPLQLGVLSALPPPRRTSRRNQKRRTDPASEAHLIPISDTDTKVRVGRDGSLRVRIPMEDGDAGQDENTTMPYWDTLGPCRLPARNVPFSFSDDDFLGYDFHLGRVYYRSFHLRGAFFRVGDFVQGKKEAGRGGGRTGAGYYRIVAAFQATKSYVGIWTNLGRKVRHARKDEIQKRGHPYILVAPLMLADDVVGASSKSDGSQELLLCPDEALTPGHVDALPYWLGEGGVSLAKISVRVNGPSSLEEDGFSLKDKRGDRGQGGGSHFCSSFLEGKKAIKRWEPLTEKQHSLLTGSPSDLVAAGHVPTEWDQIFLAKQVQFVREDRPHHDGDGKEVPFWCTIDSSDDSDGFEEGEVASEKKTKSDCENGALSGSGGEKAANKRIRAGLAKVRRKRRREGGSTMMVRRSSRLARGEGVRRKGHK